MVLRPWPLRGSRISEKRPFSASAPIITLGVAFADFAITGIAVGK